jgi:Acyl-CoA dehydrogenase, C-terminal domain
MEESERAVVDATLFELATTFDSERLTRALDEFGWEDLIRTEPVDGVASLFHAQGRAGSWSSALHDVLIGAGHLEGVVLGDATVLVPPPGSDTTLRADQGVVHGLMVGARSRPFVLAAGEIGGTTSVVRIERDRLKLEPIVGLDQRLPVLRVRGETDGSEALAEGDEAASWWVEVVAAGRRALSLELTGAMEAMLDLAITHAGQRHQFGRPVGAFQAVRHRLAESRVAASSAYAAALASFEGDEVELTAMAAKVVAGRAQKQVGAHCQQVLAGIGFTAQHPFHTYLVRVTAMDRLFGSAFELGPKLGRAILGRGGPFRMADL